MGATERARASAGEPELSYDLANCWGVTSKGRAQLRGNGSLVLGAQRLVFAYMLLDRTITIERRAIRRVEIVRSHLGKAGPRVIRVSFVNDEHLYDSVAFHVRDPERWAATLTRIIADNAERVGRPATEESPLLKSVTGNAVLVPAWTRGSFLFGAGLAVTIGVVAAAFPVAGPLVAGGLAAAGAGGALAQWIVRRRSRRKLAELAVPYEAGPEGLHVEGGLVVEAWQLSGGVVVPNAFGAMVALQRGRLLADIELQVGSVEEGRALIDALGVGTGGRAVTRKVTSWMFTKKGYAVAALPALTSVILGAALGAVASPAVSGAFLLGGFAWLMGVFYTAGMVKTRVTIGADGVRVAWLGRERLIPLAEIDRVEAGFGFLKSRLVTLHLRSGERYDITVAMRGNSIFEPFNPVEEQAILVERINEALQLSEGVRTASFDAWMDNRGSLAISDYMRELRLHVRTGMSEGGEELVAGLLRLVELASAAPAVRAAAAVALGPALDDTARERLRAAAKASALPRLRVALEAAADDRDADLVEVFSELSTEHRVKVRVAVDEELMAEAEQEVEALLAEQDSPYRSRGR